MKDVSVYFVSVHSYDIDPLEEDRAFKEQSLFAYKPGSSIIAKILLFLSH